MLFVIFVPCVAYVEALRCQRTVAVHEGEQEVLARSHRDHACPRGCAAGACQGFGNRAFYLYSLLTFSGQYSRSFSFLSRFGCLPGH